jgi:hypothetical protein
VTSAFSFVERQLAINVSDLAESGAFLGGKRKARERRYQTSYRLEQQQLRCQTRLPRACPSRDHCPVLTGRRDCPNERDLAYDERRSGILCQSTVGAIRMKIVSH